MSIQFIVNNSIAFSINYRKVAAQMISRSGRLYVSEYPSAQPFRISVRMHDYLYYPQYRSVIAALDNLDRIYEETINFASTDPNLAWLTAYQGGLTATQLSQLTLQAFSGNTFTIGLPTGITPGTVLFAAGDFIQPFNTRYTYKVNNTVTYTTGTTVTVSVHRPIIGTPPFNTTWNVGSQCTFPVIMTTNPITQMQPYTNGAYVGWSGNFDLLENITG